MQGTQSSAPLLHKETTDKKTRNILAKKLISNDLKVTGQSTHKIEPGNATGFPGFLVNVEWAK